MRARRVLLVAAALTALLPAAGRAVETDVGLRIPQVEASLAGRDVRVSAHLAPGLPAEVGKRLASGLPTTAVWEIRLYVSRRHWFDGLRDERLYDVTATRRPVSGDFIVERRLDGRLLDTVVVPGQDEVERALSSVPALPSFTMGPSVEGKPLVVRVRCIYGAGLSLGIVPTRSMTDWRRSPVFFWPGRGEAH